MPKLIHLTIETERKKEMIIHSEETRDIVDAKARRAMSRGATITWQDGSQQWVEPVPCLSDDFHCIFHADGNRIRTDIIETTRRDEITTTKVLRTVWMDYDKAWGH